MVRKYKYCGFGICSINTVLFVKAIDHSYFFISNPSNSITLFPVLQIPSLFFFFFLWNSQEKYQFLGESDAPWLHLAIQLPCGERYIPGKWVPSSHSLQSDFDIANKASAPIGTCAYQSGAFQSFSPWYNFSHLHHCSL